jgi:hypothetical protein
MAHKLFIQHALGNGHPAEYSNCQIDVVCRAWRLSFLTSKFLKIVAYRTIWLCLKCAAYHHPASSQGSPYPLCLSFIKTSDELVQNRFRALVPTDKRRKDSDGNSQDKRCARKFVGQAALCLQTVNSSSALRSRRLPTRPEHHSRMIERVAQVLPLSGICGYVSRNAAGVRPRT